MRSRVLARGLPAVGAVLAMLGTTLPAAAAPDSDFEMPFPCGESWTGTTRPSHSPSSKAIDWNRTDDVDDPVVAAEAGVVSVADGVVDSGYGKWVVIDHTASESTLYAHLSSISVKLGQTVDRGELIGTVGTTGNSTGPHLHYEQRQNRTDVVPWFHGVKFVYGSTLQSRNCVDVPLAANMLGRKPSEMVVYRRSAASTFRIYRAKRHPKVITFGTSTDDPVLGDWDGDGRANVGVRSPRTKTFRLLTAAGETTVVFGKPADKPIAGDWDGDGLWEVGIRRAPKHLFRLRAADGAVTNVVLGDANDLAVTGDWDGDGITDVGVFDQATSTYTLRILDADGLVWTARVPFGTPGDLPVVGDWDGNGKSDLGTWNPISGTFSLRKAPSPTKAARSVTAIRFGRKR